MKMLTVKEVRAITSLSISTIWRLERAGKFPLRRKISANRVAWLHDDIIQFILNREHGKIAPQGNDEK